MSQSKVQQQSEAVLLIQKHATTNKLLNDYTVGKQYSNKWLYCSNMYVMDLIRHKYTMHANVNDEIMQIGFLVQPEQKWPDERKQSTITVFFCDIVIETMRLTQLFTLLTQSVNIFRMKK